MDVYNQRVRWQIEHRAVRSKVHDIGFGDYKAIKEV
jgi:hypothetical protein